MINLTQIAKLIGVHRNTAIKYMRKGAFPSHDAYEEGGRGYLFTESYQLYMDLLNIAVHVLHGGTLTSYPKLSPDVSVRPLLNTGGVQLSVNKKTVCEWFEDDRGADNIEFYDPAYEAIADVIGSTLRRAEIEAVLRGMKWTS